MIRRLDIAIVGAGVAGLANAILLARSGHRIIVYERFATSRPVGSGLMIQPTGLAALERLGLRARLETLAHRIDRLHGVTATGKTIFDLTYGALGDGWHACGVHRAALHSVLWQCFEAADVALETGFDVVAIETASAGRSRLMATDGRKTPAFDLIIDSAGARSPLRSYVSDKPARPFIYGAVWATIPDTGIAPGALAQRYVDARIMIGHLPVGSLQEGGRPLAALFWSLKPDQHAMWRAGFPGWKDEVVALWPELEKAVETLASPEEFALANYMQFTADRVSHGNVVLTGDSAHCTSPQLGQGANHAMIDAVILADALAVSSDLPAALHLYTAARRRHIAFYQRASAIMTPFFQSDSKLHAMLRDMTFDRLKIIPYLHGEMLRTLAGLKTGLFTWADPAEIVNPLNPAQSPLATTPARA